MVPEKLTRESFAAFAGMTAQQAKSRWPKVAFLVHSLLQRAAHRSEEAPALHGAAPICARVWQTTIGNESRKLRECLVTMGVLEQVARKHQLAGLSSLYRIGPAYSAQPLRWEYVRCPPLARRLRSQTRNVEGRLDAPRRFVWQNVRRLSVPCALAERVEGYRYSSQLSQARVMLSVRALASGDVWVSDGGDPHERLYHSATNFPKHLRPFLLLDGEHVAEADISAAMPFFCLGLYGERHEAAERERYAALVSSGGFYEAVRDALPIQDAQQWAADWTAARREFKAAFNREVLFGGLRGARPPIFQAFARLFPSLAAKLAKQRTTKTGANELAKHLRTREAELFFGRIIPRLRSALPEARPVTIHDGILCKARFVEAIAEAIADEARAVYGAYPFVKISRGGGAMSTNGEAICAGA